MAEKLEKSQAHLWSGYYTQDGKQVNMMFDSFCIGKGKVAGVGRDRGQRFTLKGKRVENSVEFKKVYDGYADQYYIVYKGKLSQDSSSLEGEWQIQFVAGSKGTTGSFKSTKGELASDELAGDLEKVFQEVDEEEKVEN